MLTEKKKNHNPKLGIRCVPDFMENIDTEELDGNSVRCQRGLEWGLVSLLPLGVCNRTQVVCNGQPF